MFAHTYTILGIVVAVFLVAKALRLSTELSMLASAIAAAGYHGAVWSGEFPLRHLVEGTFTYFDVCLIFISATFFMALVKESGGVAFIVRRIVETFRTRRVICLLLLTLVMLIPGALTGSGATSVLTVGALVGSVLSAMGVDDTRKAAAIFMTAAMSAAAPPINLWAMMAAAGANLPYVGFNGPLAVLSVVGALFSMFWLAGRGSSAAGEDALSRLPQAPVGMNWLRVLTPFVVFAALLLAGRVWPFDFPVVGLPMIFMVSALMVWVLSPVKLEVWRILAQTVQNLLPLVGIMVVVGALIQVLALSGARGVISLHVVILPLSTLFATLFIILPVSEGILQYAVAPLLGVPLIMLFNMRGMDVIVALSAMSVLWPLGDCLPPTAVVGRATVMELDYKGRYFGEFVMACLVPMAFVAICCTVFLVYSKQLAFLTF
ncbi:C4-dicarboxylate ABC transporter [Fretibacterium sp. OH1220_COT-178]|uniref:C4-dicarboxylate ABC transporter n=1 Tax=Fretibacterium sp. OH1220_COT-178 TaxID=2491047 RepID=UPI000F5F9ADE|nr:C4-dicarboxylate ABC transporter [Fretibacterium sp. OH1220_COT-178]RRD64416.1 C4-dicarboxylate ABC transporter [Fretibacterium sp. OH1220_COT-178]